MDNTVNEVGNSIETMRMNGYSEDLIDLVTWMLQFEERDRPDLDQLSARVNAHYEENGLSGLDGDNLLQTQHMGEDQGQHFMQTDYTGQIGGQSVAGLNPSMMRSSNGQSMNKSAMYRSNHATQLPHQLNDIREKEIELQQKQIKLNETHRQNKNFMKNDPPSMHHVDDRPDQKYAPLAFGASNADPSSLGGGAGGFGNQGFQSGTYYGVPKSMIGADDRTRTSNVAGINHASSTVNHGNGPLNKHRLNTHKDSRQHNTNMASVGYNNGMNNAYTTNDGTFYNAAQNLGHPDQNQFVTSNGFVNKVTPQSQQPHLAPGYTTANTQAVNPDIAVLDQRSVTNNHTQFSNNTQFNNNP